MNWLHELKHDLTRFFGFPETCSQTVGYPYLMAHQLHIA